MSASNRVLVGLAMAMAGTVFAACQQTGVASPTATPSAVASVTDAISASPQATVGPGPTETPRVSPLPWEAALDATGSELFPRTTTGDASATEVLVEDPSLRSACRQVLRREIPLGLLVAQHGLDPLERLEDRVVFLL